MAIIEQKIDKEYAIYLGDCIETMETFPKESIHLSIYSPPFGGLYHYSSDVRDLSNNDSYEDFFKHYQYVIKEIFRVTLPGRITAVHCSDIPTDNSGASSMIDFPGDIIRLHEKEGFKYVARFCIWKEPLRVRNRTMAKSLMHKTIVDDSVYVSNAGADYLLIFRKKGENEIPITHPNGLLDYAGEREMPTEIKKYKNWKGSQLENRYSHWIWRQYASSFWDDIRIDNVLPFKESKDENDEKHVHPLQLDVIERCIVLWSNEGEKVLTPFMGVGSEVYGALKLKRKGIGVELKKSYYEQTLKNIQSIEKEIIQNELFPEVESVG